MPFSLPLTTQEHVRSNYSASWHERLADGEVDASVHTPAFTTRWDNYWVEGILWLVRNLDIDGTSGWSKWPSWRGNSWPPRAHQSASEGLGLPSALVRKGPASQMAQRGRGLPATRNPS